LALSLAAAAAANLLVKADAIAMLRRGRSIRNNWRSAKD
jgi:hypothetical protein